MRPNESRDTARPFDALPQVVAIVDCQNEKIILRRQRRDSPATKGRASCPAPQSGIVDIERHIDRRQPREQLNGNPAALLQQPLMALEAVNEVKLGRGQLFVALISQAAQRRHGPRKVEIANENARVSEHAKTEVTVGLESEDRAVERDCLNSVVRQRFDHSREFIEQGTVFLTCLIHIRAQGVSYFVRHHIGLDAIQGAPGKRCQPMFHRRPRRKGSSRCHGSASPGSRPRLPELAAPWRKPIGAETHASSISLTPPSHGILPGLPCHRGHPLFKRPGQRSSCCSRPARLRNVAYTRTRVRAGFIIDATVLTELDASTRTSHFDNSRVSTKTSSASVIDKLSQSRK